MVRHQWPKVRAVPVALSALFLVMAAACGTAATPTPRPTATLASTVAAPIPTPTATIAPTAAPTPRPTATIAPTAAPPTATKAAPVNEQGVTRESIGRGAGNVKGIVNIEAGKTDLRFARNILAPGGYAGWHYHNGPGLLVVEKGTHTLKQADGATVDYPAGSAVFEPKGNVHRHSNNGNVDLVWLVVSSIAGGPPAETPGTVFVPDPTTTTPVAGQPNSQGLTQESIGRGAGNVKEVLKIEEGKTDLRVARTTLAPGGYVSWHYYNGPRLLMVEKGTVTFKQADGSTADYPAGSASFQPKGLVYRVDNKGTVDAVLLAAFVIAGGPPAETPSAVFVPDPTTK